MGGGGEKKQWAERGGEEKSAGRDEEEKKEQGKDEEVKGGNGKEEGVSKERKGVGKRIRVQVEKGEPKKWGKGQQN